MMSNKINTSWGILFDQQQNSLSEKLWQIIAKIAGKLYIDVARESVKETTVLKSLYFF